MKPILSIVIPTKDRYETLIEVVDAILSWESSNYEVIVHDNSENNEVFIDKISEYESSCKFKYYHTTEVLSQAENSDKAVSKAIGYFVCFIGDDDIIIEKSIELCKKLKQYSIESISFSKASYIWPSTEFDQDQRARTFQRRFRYNKLRSRIQSIDIDKALVKQLSYREVGIKLPCVYHGIVQKNVLDKVFKIAGTYFPGPSPDIANAIALSLIVRRHVYCTYSYVISGQSFKSAAGMGLRKKHISELNEVSWLSASSIADWAGNLPYYWSAITVTAQSIITTLSAFCRPKLYSAINFNAIYAHCIIYDSVYRKRIIQKILKEKKARTLNISLIRILFEVVIHQIGRVKRRFLLKISNENEFIETRMNDITECMLLLNNNLAGENDLNSSLELLHK